MSARLRQNTTVKPTVYLETSFISYATAKFSKDVTTLERIRSSRKWWKSYREDFEVCISQVVLNECQVGDGEAIARRQTLLAGVSLLPINQEIIDLAKQFVKSGIIPDKVENDALHIAYATVHKCEFLLTWNFKHINNARIQRSVRKIVEDNGYKTTIICTPESLMGR